MKESLKTLLTLLVMYFSSTAIRAQENTNEWFPYFENDQIQLEITQAHRADSANGIFNNYLLIRLTNKTPEKIAVSFQKQLSYNQQQSSTDPIAPIQLAPQEILTGSVEPGTNKALRIFVNQPNGFNKNVLTDYSLTAIRSQIITD